MHPSCNSCGAFENLKGCKHCPTILCDRCRHHHESTCEVVQKKKASGQGPTVLRPDIYSSPVVHTPSAHPVSDADQGLAAVSDLLRDSK